MKHVRPGNGFVPAFPLTSKLEVNGANTHPLFRFLRLSLPTRGDRTYEQDMDEPHGTQIGAAELHNKAITYAPLNPTDVVWNFEKFLLNKDGEPIQRFSAKFETIKLKEEIEKLL